MSGMKCRRVLYLLLCFVSIFSDSSQGIQKKIVVVIASYNNEKWCEKNLNSVLNQRYENYRIIYINDASTDKTGCLVDQYCASHDLHGRVTIVHNEKRRGALANYYHAIHLCDDHEIIATVDGDDWLINDRVLAYLNKVYADPEVWLTYGQYEYYPYTETGICEEFPEDVLKNGTFRTAPWVTSQLRTFYAGLFKKIKKEDLFYEGDFLTITQDVAIMMPMLEMAQGHIKFIPHILYIYNVINPLNDHTVDRNKQVTMDRMIRSKEWYQKIESPF